jgi:hypothetical protein
VKNYAPKILGFLTFERLRETKKYAKIIEIPVRRVKTNKKWII